MDNSDDVTTFLSHYGVIGMKWGKRSGSLSSRISGAHQDSVQRRLTSNREIAAGRGETRDYFRTSAFRVGGALTGGRMKSAAKRTKTLEKRAERLSSGKRKASDVLDGLINTPMTDLLISRTDNRGSNTSSIPVQSGKSRAAKIIAGVGGAIVVSSMVRQAATGSR